MGEISLLFNSWIFIIGYLPLVFVVYFCLAKKRYVELARIWLALSSLFFYGYWDVSYVPLLLASIGWNYLFGQLLQKREHEKFLLTIAILGNLLLLGYYKYAGFFVETVNEVAGVAYDVPNIILPLGISFFTFTQTAYLVDVYRGETKIARGDVIFISFICDDISSFDCWTDNKLSGHDAAILPIAQLRY